MKLTVWKTHTTNLPCKVITPRYKVNNACVQTRKMVKQPKSIQLNIGKYVISKVCNLQQLLLRCFSSHENNTISSQLTFFFDARMPLFSFTVVLWICQCVHLFTSQREVWGCIVSASCLTNSLPTPKRVEAWRFKDDDRHSPHGVDDYPSRQQEKKATKRSQADAFS